MPTECPSCRRENPEGALFCSKCATRLEGAGSGAGKGIAFTRTMETPGTSLGRGTVFAGRFEIIEELGAGGMGRVFRAFDKEVGEEVALKLLHPEIALSKRTVDRFRNEIKLARGITHRNICRMHELHQDGQTLFITMEYVPGQDLRGLIKQTGALTAGKSISIGRQVAEGLAEAHSLGVIHRDLKPQNIMVDKEGNAKVMDFGIARSLAGAGVTAEGSLIGTPEYMSPEQVEGKEADRRSDIYALGVILFEMATGRVPFEGDTPLSVAYKHKNEPPPPPRKLNSQVPEPLNKLILRCLEKDRGDRYQTADEVLADLALVEEGLPITERVAMRTRATARRSTLRPPGTRRFLVPGLAILAFVLAALVLWPIVFPGKNATALPKIPNSVAVTSFVNLTGDESLDIWTRGIAERFISNLGNTGNFHVLPWERMRDVLRQTGKRNFEFIDSDMGFELCRRAGIETLVTGTMMKAGETFALDVRILDAKTKNLRKSASSKGEGISSIINAQVDELSREIAEVLGAGASFQVSAILTGSEDAYRFYLIGMERNDNLDVEKAAEYLEKAVQIDPSFALAQHELGMAYLTLNKPAAAREALVKALKSADRASAKDRLVIAASHAQWVELDGKKAVTMREDILRKYPEDKRNLFWLGFVDWHQGRPTEAVKAFEDSLRLDPDFGQAANHLGAVYLDLGEFDKAIEATKRYIALTPKESNGWDSLGIVYARMGKIEDGIAAFKEALKLRPDTYSSVSGLGYLLAFKERYAEALDSVESYLSLNLSAQMRAQTLWWKAFYLYWLGRFTQSHEVLRQAHESARTVDFTNKIAIPLLSYRLSFDAGGFEAAKRSAQSYVDDRNKLSRGSKAGNLAKGHFMSGLCDLRSGKSEAAASHLEEMKTLLRDVDGREKEDLAENIALFQMEIDLAEGDVEEALSFLEKNDPYEGDQIDFYISGFSLVTVLDGNWLRFREGLARAYAQNRDLGRAVDEYERLTAPDRRNTGALVHPRYYYSLGLLFEAEGRKDKARSNYRRFLSLWKDADPGMPEVEDARKRLAALR